MSGTDDVAGMGSSDLGVRFPIGVFEHPTRLRVAYSFAFSSAFWGVRRHPELHCNSKESMPMKRLLLAAALLCSTFAFAQAPQSQLPVPPAGVVGRITATSVWQMSATFLATAHAA